MKKLFLFCPEKLNVLNIWNVAFMLDKSYILWHFQADECVCFVRLSQSSAATAAGRKYAHKLK